MKKPTRKQTINLRIKRPDGVETLEGIVGVNIYPLAIHKKITDFEAINDGSRSRYSTGWRISHIPTGTSFGIMSSDWEAIMAYVDSIKNEPALLMLTLETMTSHPDYDQLCKNHSIYRKRYFRY